MAVVCVPGMTVAGNDASGTYSQSDSYLYVSARESVDGDVAATAQATAEDVSALRWDSTAGEPAVWDTEQTSVWKDATNADTTYKAGSHAEFGDAAGLNTKVQIAPENVTAETVKISGSGYQFIGGDMVVTEQLSVEESAEIDSVLVIGSSTSPLEIQVAKGKTLTASVLETAFRGTHEHHIYEHGSFVKSGDGTLSIKNAVHGSITGTTVKGGGLELGSGVSLDVGANEIKGGKLENVQMLVTGELTRTLTGQTDTAHNLIKSADDKHAALLKDVTLNAGTSTEYATLQNVVFAGNSTLTGYITFESTQAQHEIGVATGSTLTVHNVTFDLRGIAVGSKALIVNRAVEDSANGLLSKVEMPAGISGVQGEIVGWNTAKFVYSGVEVNPAALDTSVAGMVTLIAHHEANLYWDGSENNLWDPTSTNWSLVENELGDEKFTALSHVIFGDGTHINHRNDIIVTQDMVVMDMDVLAGGYNFSGARVAVLSDAYLKPDAGKVTFNDQFIVMGNLNTEGAGSVELLGATTVAKNVNALANSLTIAGDLMVGGDFIINAGNAETAGHLDITGNVTAKNMNISVSAGDKADAAYKEHLVNVTGNLSVDKTEGAITIGGTAEQHYLGVVTAGNLIINTQENTVYFDHLHVGSMTVGKGAQVHVHTASASVSLSTSEIPVINLAGTLALDVAGATYDRGYTVNLQDDAARLKFGSGTTIGGMSIIGIADDSGYTNLAIDAPSSTATITHMEKLGNLSIVGGSVTLKDSTGVVHGSLSLDKVKLNLKANNLMAEGSGAINLTNDSRLNIGSTTQNLSADNAISLSSASSITGDAKGTGLVFADGASITYDKADNSISANMVVDQGHTLNIVSANSGSSLDISGKLSGSGAVQLSGDGKVMLSAENSFSGSVTVGDGSTLSLHDALTLSKAGVVLNNNGTLSLDTDTAVYLNSLTFNSGATLSFSTIVDTDKFDADQAALHVTSDIGASGSGTLNISFADALENQRTYNLLTGLSSLDGITLNVQHNGVVLHASQYKVAFDAQSGLLYMQTLMGNVWEGLGSSNIWKVGNNDKNWSDHSNYNEDTDYAIFGNLTNGARNEIEVQGMVDPKAVYFVADDTDYTLTGSGQLASDTKINKDGKADVTLAFGGNNAVGSALGNVDIQAGTMTLANDFAVQRTVTVASGATLQLQQNGVELMLVDTEKQAVSYTLSANAIGNAILSGVTLDADGIRGEVPSEDDGTGAESEYNSYAHNLLVSGNAELSYLNLRDFEANGNVTLSNVKLTSSKGDSHVLTDVTIGTGVVVDDKGNYTLSGNLTFDGTLTNNGKVTLSDITHVEIGKIKYKPEVDATSGTARYLYELISSSSQDGLTASEIEKKYVSINGVNLATGLAKGVEAFFKDNRNGSFTVSIADGTVGMPQWDERWGKTENAPGISRLYSSTADYFEMAAGNGGKSSYYMYDTLVNETNAAKVNDGNAIVVTLSSVATGAHAVGSRYDGKNVDHEVWIEDRSYIKNIIGGLDNEDRVTPNTSQNAATHILVNSFVQDDEDPPKDGLWYTWEKEYIIGGSRWCNQNAESFVTVQNGEVYNIFGGSCGATYDKAKEVIDEWGNTIYVEDWGNPVFKDESGNVVTNEWGSPLYVTQKGTTHVFVEGGKVGEIFAAGFYCTLEGTQWVNDRPRAVELVLTGGKLGGENLRVFGGGDRGYVAGDIYVRMEGDAEIISRLLGGSNVGYVKGNIEMDLISGKAFRVDAAGLGWRYEWEENGQTVVYYDPANIEGNVLVNLYSDFKLGHGSDFDLKAGIYGGMETTNYVTLIGDCTSTLHFAEGAKYELGKLDAGGYTASEESIIVTGFDRFTLEEGAHAVLALGYFDIDMDPNRTLDIIGKGVVEVIGHGANFGRNIKLSGGATLKVSTSDIKPATANDFRTISVTSGSTLDLTGYPVVTAGTTHTGLGFKTDICGDGVDGKGAIFKGTVHKTDADKTLSADMVSLPEVTLTGNASVGVMNHEVLHMCGYQQGKTTLALNGYTFTKQGLGTFVARNVEMSEGTILVHNGDMYIDKGTLSPDTDIVLAAGTSLTLSSVKSVDGVAPSIHALSGAGRVILNDTALTLHTTSNSVYNPDYYMKEELSYDQFMSTTGFGYGVFSGTIGEEIGSSSLSKTGDGVHYLSGSANTYSGGTFIKEGRLYLLGTSAQSMFVKGDADGEEATVVASGVAGTGAITWAGTGAELYLGHGSRIYNDGIYNDGKTNEQGGVMTIGVEGVVNGKLADFVGIHSKGADGSLSYVIMGGEEYVEIDTHNLKSISVNAKYANGKDYVADKDIDRNLMLLVKASKWQTAKDAAVKGCSDTGYNEAVYSGVLSGDAMLRKVGIGTLVIDQANSYTRGTEIAGGTLRVRGWGTLGENKKENAVNMTQEGSTLMFTYNTGYGDEPSEIANNIQLKGTGDARWEGQAATDGGTAALISAIGPASTLTLSGDISGTGNVRHSGEGKLVLSGDSSYSGGTYVSRGTVEVQSATGLGATGLASTDKPGAVTVEHDADLHVTVEKGYTDSRMVTTLAGENNIAGDVSIVGTDSTERILHMASDGYNAASTSLGANGTLLLNGAAVNGKAVSAHSHELTGNGSAVVSDAAGTGAAMKFDSIIDYTGDFRVEGNNASIAVDSGKFEGGSIHVSGKNASVNIVAGISITDGETLSLSSAGDFLSASGLDGAGASVTTSGTISIAAGAVLSVSNQSKKYTFNIAQLQEDSSLDVAHFALMQAPSTFSDVVYKEVGTNSVKYDGRYDLSIAVNTQAAGAAQATGGVTLDGGSTYNTEMANTSLMGGRLTLDTMENSLINFFTTTDVTIDGLADTQLVLFSDVNGVYFGYDKVMADANTGIYYTRADRYFAGSDYIDASTLLVYDSYASIVYLHMEAIPEPATATLSLLALAALAARRRRK